MLVENFILLLLFEIHLESYTLFFYPQAHQQNVIVEWKCKHIVETKLTLLAQASLFLSFCANAFEIAANLINLLPSPVLQNQSPHFMVYHKSPGYTFLKTFGYEWPDL